MYLLVCYDVVTDRRRNRLFKRLRGLLKPVQKSVFEGELPDRRLPELVKMVHDTIDSATDTVRIYSLCRGCRGLIDLIGVAAPVADPNQDWVV